MPISAPNPHNTVLDGKFNVRLELVNAGGLVNIGAQLDSDG